MPTPKHHSKTCEGSDHVPALPPPPEPSADGGIVPTLDTISKDSDAIPQGYDIDIFTLSSVAALKILCGTVETLVKITGDVPPTPPVSAPNTPISRVIRTPQIIRAIAQSEAKITQRSCQDRPPSKSFLFRAIFLFFRIRSTFAIAGTAFSKMGNADTEYVNSTVRPGDARNFRTYASVSGKGYPVRTQRCASPRQNTNWQPRSSPCRGSPHHRIQYGAP